MTPKSGHHTAAEGEAVRPDTVLSALDFLEANDDQFFAGFTPFFTLDGLDIRRRQVPSSKLLIYNRVFQPAMKYEYKVRGPLPATKCELLVSVYLDFEYRLTWDPHMLRAEKLGNSRDDSLSPSPVSIGADSGVEVEPTSLLSSRLETLRQMHSEPHQYYYAIKMPLPLATRDYVYSVRSWSEECSTGSQTCKYELIEGMASKHESYPETPPTIRIENYYQQIAVKPTADNCGTILAMRYYDDPRGSIPHQFINFAAKKGVPAFLNGLTTACAKYDDWLTQKSA
ncbi:hypothetical protein HK405_004748 [Cladochytrium tenue]|nr:hypothetical protein HK405_004748 [Cladochytrium tenue]